MIHPIANIPHFNSFNESIHQYVSPNVFTLMQNNKPHPLCLLAAHELQYYLNNQQEWKHNFGLSNQSSGAIVGKMFGVLVVRTPSNQIGYLSAFSGKLAGVNTHSKFVPPIFDSLTENGFLTKGMLEIARMGEEIKHLNSQKDILPNPLLNKLKNKRKKFSVALQTQLFKHYFFTNNAAESKSLFEIFTLPKYKNPPSGAGECATPKLLQYAFNLGLKPLALAEFWWGQSPKSTRWKHGQFYPCCKEKCEPILVHMLKGIAVKYE
jgi:tRNA pseudouridine32 synthase/23S rRNA pseudouridine746 synthase